MGRGLWRARTTSGCRRLEGDEVRSVGPTKVESEGGGGLDAGRQDRNCQPCLGSGVKMDGEWQRRGG